MKRPVALSPAPAPVLARASARVRHPALAVLLAAALAVAGCAAVGDLRGAPGTEAAGDDQAPDPVDRARMALGTGNLPMADLILAQVLVPGPPDKKTGAPGALPATPQTAELLALRAELRIRQARYADADADALAAMALLPPTAATGPCQRSVHVRLAQLLEDASRDDDAERHLTDALSLCEQDAALVEGGDCDVERRALVRIRVARGRYAEAEPLVLAEISSVQSRYGSWDLRMSVALCHAARFYARQGKYALSGPLFTRSFDLWKNVHEEAASEHARAIAAGQPSPFDDRFLAPAPGNFPFTAPCGLEDQPLILFKLGKAGVAADAVRYEQQLWAGDTGGGAAAVAQLDTMVARGADTLDIAAARHAVAFVAMRKGDTMRAEQELRQVSEAYAATWPTLPISERRYRVEDHLRALESLLELLRSSKRFAEATALGQRAAQVAAGAADEYDALRLDTQLSLARTYREMRDGPKAEAAAADYLDAIVRARGDRSADYAWALRTISYAYLLRDELDASERMEMQAKAIWAKQSTVAPQF